MSGMIEFDERQARAVETMYQNPDVTGQRQRERSRWLGAKFAGSWPQR